MVNDEKQPLLPSSHPGSLTSLQSFERRPKHSRKVCIACAGILSTVLLERLAFYSLTSNLVIYLNSKPLQWISYEAMNAMYILWGVVYLSSVIGGWWADIYVGRFKAILFCLVLYIIGYAFFTVLAYYTQNTTDKVPFLCFATKNWTVPEFVDYNTISACSEIVYLDLLVLGIAAGIFRANITPFGVEQMTSQDSAIIRMYFYWYYWFINLGSLIAIAVCTYYQLNDSRGFYISYFLSTVCLAVATIIFVACYNSFISYPPSKSIMRNVLSIWIIGCKSRKKIKSRKKNERSREGHSRDIESSLSCMDFAKVQYGGDFDDVAIENAKAIAKILFLFAVLIPYWLVYYQMQTTFNLQGDHLRLIDTDPTNHTAGSFQMPSAWMSLCDVIIVLIFVPLLDRIIYPCLEARNINISTIRRFQFGLVVALLAVLAAGVLESQRLEVNSFFNQTIHDTLYNATNMSIFWQAPQYTLIGVSECFTSIAGLEIAYSLGPSTMKSAIMGLFNFFMGVGSFLGTGLMYLIILTTFWFPKENLGDFNGGHLDYYYYLLGAIQFIFIIVFTVIIIYKDVHIPKTSQNISKDLKHPVNNGNNSRPTSRSRSTTLEE